MASNSPPASRTPAALGADPVALGKPVRKELLPGLLVGGGDVAGRMGGDLLHGVAVLGHRLTVQVNQRREGARLAANDGEDDRVAVLGAAQYRLRGAAHADPGRQQVVLQRRIDAQPG